MTYKDLPELHDLKTFDFLCFASSLEKDRTKLDPRARKCIFLNYKTSTKGYVMFDIKTRKIFESNNVKFYECIFFLFTKLTATMMKMINMKIVMIFVLNL